MNKSNQDREQQLLENMSDFLTDLVEKMPLPKDDEQMKAMQCKIIEQKYKKKVFELVVAGLLPDKDLKRISTALQSITIIYKQILGGGWSYHE